jgi:flagellar biosynthesis/type III secretory pathway M-ring protein FliF/YscJ
MATDKRERQRANRAAKQAAEAKAARQAKVLDVARRVGIWVVVILVLFVIAYVVFSDDGTPTETTLGALALLV